MKKKSLLWKINAAESISYIFGTMHVKDQNAFTAIDKALKAISSCTHFYSEIDLDQAKTDIKHEHYLLPEGERISLLLGKRKFDKMHKVVLKSFGVDLGNWDLFLPMIVVNTLTESILREDHSMALDQYLWHRAAERNMLLGGVETVENQLHTLKGLDVQIQLKMLKDIVRNVSSFRKSVFKLVDAYQSEDIHSIYKMIQKSMGEFRNVLVYNRNKNMSEFINANLNQPSFFAVGAAHLAGQKGVLNLLKAKGLKLEAVY